MLEVGNLESSLLHLMKKEGAQRTRLSRPPPRDISRATRRYSAEKIMTLRALLTTTRTAMILVVGNLMLWIAQVAFFGAATLYSFPQVTFAQAAPLLPFAICNIVPILLLIWLPRIAERQRLALAKVRAPCDLNKAEKELSNRISVLVDRIGLKKEPRVSSLPHKRRTIHNRKRCSE